MEKESKRKTKVATVLVCDTHATPPLCRDKHYPGNTDVPGPVPVLLYCTGDGGSHRSILYSTPYSTVYIVLYTGTVVLSTVPCVLLYHNLSYELL